MKLQSRINLKMLTLFLSFFCLSTLLGGELSILTMGDLLIAKGVESRMESIGKSYPFEKLAPEFEKYSLVFANLETPVTTRGKAHSSKAWTFRTKPENARYLKELKLDVVSLSNNHMVDYGKEGLVDTVNFVKDIGLAYSGAGNNLKEARKAAVVKREGVDMVFLSYCERPPMDMYATDTRHGIAPIDLAIITEDIKKYRKNNNLVFVSLHWGIERTHYPRKDQIETAHAIIDAGADAIIGHHPHVPQGIETYRGKPIIYSLGNAVCGFYNRKYTENIMVAFHYSGTTLSQLEIIPIEGDNYKMHFQPYILTGNKGRKVIKDMQLYSSIFTTKIEIKDGRGYIYMN